MERIEAASRLFSLIGDEGVSRLEDMCVELTAMFEAEIRAAEEVENWRPCYSMKQREMVSCGDLKKFHVRDWSPEELPATQALLTFTDVPRTPLARQPSAAPPTPVVTEMEKKIRELEAQNSQLRAQLTADPRDASMGVESIEEFPTAALFPRPILDGLTQPISNKTPIPTSSCTPSPSQEPTLNPLSPDNRPLPNHTPAAPLRPAFTLPPLSGDLIAEQQYELTPWEDSDAENGKSRGEREDEKRQRRQKKKIPGWCENWIEVAKEQNRVDPDSVFFSLKVFPKCDLSVIFQESEKIKKRKRGSSGNWGVDGLTDMEISSYKQKMGLTLTAASLTAKRFNL